MNNLLVKKNSTSLDITVEEVISNTKDLLTKMPRDTQGLFIRTKKPLEENLDENSPKSCIKT